MQAANCGFARFLVRGIFFIGVLDDREIDVSRHLGVDIAGTDDRLQNGFNAADITLLNFLRVFQLADIEAARVGVRR